MIDVTKMIELLKNKRKIFHSEDDLKLSIGMEFLSNYKDCRVRLERPIDIKMIDFNENSSIARAAIDIVIIENNGNLIPIELKYKTKKVQLESGNEKYQLTNHSAADTGRFSFRKDIFRIEQYLESHPNVETGYVLILTNDKAYIDNDVSSTDNWDKYLSFHDKAVIEKQHIGWNYSKIDSNKYELRNSDKRWWQKDKNKLHWTCSKELFYKLDLRNSYEINWITYSSLTETKFKYCLIKIDKK